MPSPIFIKIESNVQAFVAELSDLVRAAALDAVQGALGGGAAPARRGPGRPKGSGRKPGRPAKAASVAAPPKRRGRRVRRSSEDVDATAAKFLAFVKANDGKRVEEIAKGLGVHSSALTLPARRLLAAKAVRTTGQKRGTKYHVAGKGAGKATIKAAKRAKKA